VSQINLFDIGLYIIFNQNLRCAP